MHNCILDEVDEELIEEPPVSRNYKRLLFDDGTQSMVAFFRDGFESVNDILEQSVQFDWYELFFARARFDLRNPEQCVEGIGNAVDFSSMVSSTAARYVAISGELF